MSPNVVNESVNGLKSSGTKGVEFYFLSCPTGHNSEVVCP